MRLGTDAPPMTGVVLAGGRGSRLGVPKARLQYGGETLLERTTRMLDGLFGRVVLVSDDPDVARVVHWGDVIRDEVPGIGPMGGLHAALGHITTEHAFVVACDMPRLQPDLIAAQARMAWDADVVVPRHDGLLEPLHAVYGRKCLPALERQIALGDYRLRSIFDQVRTVYLDLVPPEAFRDAFANINTLTDLQDMPGRHQQDGQIAGAG